MAFLNMTNQISGWQRQGPVKLVLLTYPFCYEISCSPTFCQDFQQENLVELTFLSPVFLPYIHSPQESNFIFLKYTSSHDPPLIKILSGAPWPPSPNIFPELTRLPMIWPCPPSVTLSHTISNLGHVQDTSSFFKVFEPASSSAWTLSPSFSFY